MEQQKKFIWQDKPHIAAVVFVVDITTYPSVPPSFLQLISDEGRCDGPASAAMSLSSPRSRRRYPRDLHHPRSPMRRRNKGERDVHTIARMMSVSDGGNRRNKDNTEAVHGKVHQSPESMRQSGNGNNRKSFDVFNDEAASGKMIQYEGGGGGGGATIIFRVLKTRFEAESDHVTICYTGHR